MNTGTQDRKKLAIAGSLGLVALSAVIYTFAGGGSDAPAPAPAPVPAVASARATPTPNGAVAAKISRSTMDPTLHPEGMELTESLVYTGSGRNIFSANSAPAVQAISIPKAIGPARPPQSMTPVYTRPPPPPPIDLRFFGTATRPNGSRQAFFVRGDDVFYASEGDVVSRRYKIGPVLASSVEVTDLTNNNTQRLPLLQQ